MPSRHAYPHAAACLITVLAPVAGAQAGQFYSWKTATSGAYENAANWNTTPATGLAPGATDVAQFGLGAASAYTVSFASNPSIGGTSVFGDRVILDLNGQTFAPGTLNIANSAALAELTVTDGTLQTGASVTNVANNLSGATATLTLDTGALWTNTTGTIWIGVAGSTGEVLLRNGADLTNTTASVVVGNGGTGRFIADGVGTTVTSAGRFTIATSGANADGTLTVRNGASVSTTGDTQMAFSSGAGTLEVKDPGSSYATTGIVVGRLGSGTVEVTSGGSLLTRTTMIIGEQNGGGGEVTVSGVGSTLTVGDGASANNSLEVGFNTGAPGTLRVLDGGVVSVTKTTGATNQMRIGVQASALGAVEVEGAGVAAVSRLNIHAKSGLTLGGGGSTGTLRIGEFGEVNITEAASVTNAVTNNANGKIQLDGGTLTLPSGKTLANTGTLEGDGTIARYNSVANGLIAITSSTATSVLRPGGAAAVGTIAIENGSLTQNNAAARLLVDLGLPSAGQHDKIVATDTNATAHASVALSNGLIDFSLLPGYTPQNGTYDLIAAPTVTVAAGVLSAGQADAQSLVTPYGGAASLALVGTAGGGQTLRMTFSGLPIPEPCTGLLLISGAAALLRRRRL